MHSSRNDKRNSKLEKRERRLRGTTTDGIQERVSIYVHLIDALGLIDTSGIDQLRIDWVAVQEVFRRGVQKIS